jgi:succinoglycan biosynthesis protein ExoA
MGDSGPVIATVVPVLNEASYIEACLKSLIQQSLSPAQHMVLVFDGGSTDSTRNIVERMILLSEKAGGPRIELHENPGKFVSQARNLALELLPASVQFTVEMIGHSTVDPDHLELRLSEWNLIQSEHSKPLGAVGVKVLPRQGEHGRVESWIEGCLKSPFGSGNGQFDGFNERGLTQVPAFAMHSRKAVESVHGWDVDFITSQDSDLSMRLLNSGFLLARTPATHVRMVKRSSLGKWWKMGHRYGFWRMKILKKYPKRASLREFLPWFGALSTVALLALQPSYAVVLPACYLVVLSVEGLRGALMSKRLSLVLGIPVCLFMLHSSFSVGLLDGFVRKGRAPKDR